MNINEINNLKMILLYIYKLISKIKNNKKIHKIKNAEFP
jgi:hypothetical protein